MAEIPDGIPAQRQRGWVDLLAIAASAACLAHCLALPLLFALLPAATRLIDVPEAIHLWSFVAAVPASAYAMGRGYRHHETALPALLGGLGLLLLGLGAADGRHLLFETGVTMIGSALLGLAHFGNWRLQRVTARDRHHALANSQVA